MGMDLIAIIEHNKTTEEILTSTKLIDYSSRFRKTYLDQYPNAEMKNAKWIGLNKMTIQNLERIWETEENGRNQIEELKGLNYYAEMDIPYAELTFHRQTISISPHGLHKYGNLRTPKWAKFILKMNREIARIFESKQIVYCVDSYEPPELIYERSLSGLNIKSLIKLGNDKFGIPPKEINKAVQNIYFIDEFDLNIDNLIEWDWKDIGL